MTRPFKANRGNAGTQGSWIGKYRAGEQKAADDRINGDMTLREITAVLQEHGVALWKMRLPDGAGEVVFFLGPDAGERLASFYEVLVTPTK